MHFFFFFIYKGSCAIFENCFLMWLMNSIWNVDRSKTVDAWRCLQQSNAVSSIDIYAYVLSGFSTFYHELFLRAFSPQNENPVSIYSPSCCSKCMIFSYLWSRCLAECQTSLPVSLRRCWLANTPGTDSSHWHWSAWPHFTLSHSDPICMGVYRKHIILWSMMSSEGPFTLTAVHSVHWKLSICSKASRCFCVDCIKGGSCSIYSLW